MKNAFFFFIMPLVGVIWQKMALWLHSIVAKWSPTWQPLNRRLEDFWSLMKMVHCFNQSSAQFPCMQQHSHFLFYFSLFLFSFFFLLSPQGHKAPFHFQINLGSMARLKKLPFTAPISGHYYHLFILSFLDFYSIHMFA